MDSYSLKDDLSGDREHALIRGVAGGDEAALAALYDEWGQRVHALAHWMLGDPDEVEAVVEETFWQIWRTAIPYASWRAPGAARILMIARSRALDRLRALRRNAARAGVLSTARAAFDGQPSGGVEDPGAHLESTELHAELVAALGELPAEQREALGLAFFGGLSHAEIAGQTAQPLGTIKTRIRLAMQKLRQRLAFLRDEDL
jgi:RNA polymerase sigma-70 factor (ECF subfamily)